MIQPFNETISLSMVDHHPDKPLSLEELEKAPHLKQLAEAIRKILHTNKTLGDIDFENKLGYAEFVNRCKNDLIFFLQATNQHHLIAVIFQDPGIIAKLIRAIQAHHYREKTREHHTQEPPSIPATSKKTDEHYAQRQDSSTLFSWTHPDSQLSNMDKLFHYEQELQRITVEHQARKTQMHRNAVTSDLGHVDSMLTELRQNPQHNEQAIARLDTMKANTDARMQEILSASLYNADGTVNLQASAQQEKEMRELSERIDSFLDDYRAQYGSENPQINQIYAARELERAQYNADIRSLDAQFAVKKEEVMRHLDAASVATKEEFQRELKSAIGILEKTSVAPEQRSALTQTITKLQQYDGRITHARDFDALQTIIKECNTELKYSEHLVRDSLSPSDARNFKDTIQAIEKMLVNTSAHDLAPDAPIAEDGANLHDNGPPPPYEQEVSVVSENMGSAAPSQDSVDISRERQMEMRAALQDGRRAHGMFSEVQDLHDTFGKVKEEVHDAWAQVQEVEAFDEVDAGKITEITQLIEELNGCDSCASVSRETVDTLMKTLNSMRGSYETMGFAISELEKFSRIIENSPSPDGIENSPRMH